MKRIVLISCVSKKLDHPAPAAELYTSPLFRYNLAFAARYKPDMVFILSAKYGLVTLDQIIQPYNVTLKNMPAAERKAWAVGVKQALAKRADLQHDHFIFLAGEPYRKYLIPSMESFEIPLQGKGIGKQLQFLKGKFHEQDLQ